MLCLWGTPCTILYFILKLAFLHYDPYVAPIVFSWCHNLPVPPGNQDCLTFMPLALKLSLFMSSWHQNLCFNHFTQGNRKRSIYNTRTSLFHIIVNCVRWFLYKSSDLSEVSPEHHQVSSYFIFKYILLKLKS